MSECLLSRNRETGAAAGNPLGTKPFLKISVCWLVEHSAETPLVLGRPGSLNMSA